MQPIHLLFQSCNLVWAAMRWTVSVLSHRGGICGAGSVRPLAILVAFVCMQWCIGVSVADDIVVQPALLRTLEEAIVPALEEGLVTRVIAKEGDRVSPNDTVVHIDDRAAAFKKSKADLEYRIASVKAEDDSAVIYAEAEVKVAAAAVQRAVESRRKFPDTPSQAEMDELELRHSEAQQHLKKAKTELELAKLSKLLAEASLENASLELERHSFKSPIAGTVVEVNSKPGDWVHPGDVLVRIVRNDRLRVEGYVPREQVRPGIVGATVHFIVEGGKATDPPQVGKVVFLSLEIDPNDRSQRIVAEIDNTQGMLGPGLRGRLVIKTR